MPQVELDRRSSIMRLPSQYAAGHLELRMDIPRLPFDILANVMAVSPPDSIRSLMSTCHALHGEGPKYLLRNGVVLRDPRDVLSFTNFMFSTNPAYWTLFRVLDIRFGCHDRDKADPRSSQEWVSCLTRLLTHPSLFLDTLILHDAESLLLSGRPLEQAISTLSTLRHLTVCNGQTSTRSMLEHLPSRLVSADISLSPYIHAFLPLAQTQAESLRWNPLFLLRRSCDSLEELAWTQHDHLPSPLAQDVPPTTPIPRFARLRKLSLLYGPGSETEEIVDIVPRLAPFVRTFPGLSCLRVAQLRAPSSPYTHARLDGRYDALQALCHVRQENAAALQRLALDDAEPEPWSALAECSGDLPSLFSLSLALRREPAHPLKRLHVRRYAGTAEDWTALGAVLEDLRPVSLSVCIRSMDALLGRDGLFALLSWTSVCPRALRVEVQLPWAAPASDEYGLDSPDGM
ncbi:hypothetical protein C8Q76DRAFT_689373 [Earliella scabrosa]|nr:hypothetical protein C8Q76DRAFT_689373 [Earliella scabrosa]